MPPDSKAELARRKKQKRMRAQRERQKRARLAELVLMIKNATKAPPKRKTKSRGRR